MYPLSFFKVLTGLPFKSKDQFCCDQLEQTFRTISFLSIDIFHTGKVQICTNGRGLRDKSLSFRKGYLTKWNLIKYFLIFSSFWRGGYNDKR